MAEITKTNSENTEEILASIRKLMSEDGVTLESQDGDKTEPESSRTADLAVVEELRGLIDEYTALPEDLVSAVSELESDVLDYLNVVRDNILGEEGVLLEERARHALYEIGARILHVPDEKVADKLRKEMGREMPW